MFAAEGNWPEYDDGVGLDGCKNRTFFNIKSGFLPDISIVENAINSDKRHCLFHIEILKQKIKKLRAEFDRLESRPSIDDDPQYIEVPEAEKEAFKRIRKLELKYLSDKIGNLYFCIYDWQSELEKYEENK